MPILGTIVENQNFGNIMIMTYISRSFLALFVLTMPLYTLEYDLEEDDQYFTKERVKNSLEHIKQMETERVKERISFYYQRMPGLCINQAIKYSYPNIDYYFDIFDNVHYVQNTKKKRLSYRSY